MAYELVQYNGRGDESISEDLRKCSPDYNPEKTCMCCSFLFMVIIVAALCALSYLYMPRFEIAFLVPFWCYVGIFFLGTLIQACIDGCQMRFNTFHFLFQSLPFIVVFFYISNV